MQNTLLVKYTNIGQVTRLVASALILLAAGCGGSSSGDSTPGNPGGNPGEGGTGNGQSVDYEKLVPAQIDSEPLVRMEGDALSRYLKNGMRLQTSGYYLAGDGAAGGEVDFSAPPVSEDARDLPDFSDTNVHVDGVDEADTAKYDGLHWFVSYVPTSASTNFPGVQIFSTDPVSASAELVGSYPFTDTNWGSAASLYLQKDDGIATHLIAIRNQWGNIEPFLPGPTPEISDAQTFDIWPGPQNSEIRVEFIDVQSVASPQLDNALTLDGSLINSRRIGNTLYLVSRFDPWLHQLALEASLDGSREKNETLLEETSLQDILPRYRIGDNEAPLTQECYVQQSYDEHSGFYSLVNITAIDLTSQSVLDSQCISTSVDDMTMSTDALYLTASTWNTDGSVTNIHKFDLQDSAAVYAATGAVAGGLRGRAPYRVHQYQDQLRVVTSDWQENIEHRLFVLEQSGQYLNAVAELPNANRPEAIGKPGEDIYAVRFSQDQAYIVTFLQIDPLYVIDLSNPEDPKISGELEVPGFSTYIHPLNEKYLFTLGHNANGETGWSEGIKAQLIKVVDGEPLLVGDVNIGQENSSSEALYDIRALNFLPDGNGGVRVAFPVKVYARNDQDISAWQYSGLQMVELNGLDGESAAIVDQGVLIADSAGEHQWDSGYGVRRGLLHADAVFYAHNNQVWANLWGSETPPEAPVGGEPIACTEELRYGVSITVWVEGDACSAEVLLSDGDYSETLIGGAMNGTNSCVFMGAAERAGTYDVSVTKDGYMPFTSSGIRVSADACHVKTRYQFVNLWPVEPE